MSETHRLKYRPFIQSFYRWVMALTVLAEVIIVRWNLPEIVNETWYVGVVKLIAASTLPISIFVRVFFFVRPRIFSEVELLEDRLIVHRGSKQQEVLFDQVKDVEISLFSPRFFGGFTLELNSGQKFVFLSILKDNHKILEKVLKVKPELTQDKKFEKYLKISPTVDLSWQRTREKFYQWYFIVFKYFALPIIVASVFQNMNFKIADEHNFIFLLVWSTVSTWLLAFIFNHIEERFINFYLLRGELTQNKQDWVQKGISASFYLTYALIFILLKGARP